MGVIKEFQCSCGIFEADLPICPRCGASEPYVKRVFLTPPAFKSDRTKFTDSSLKEFTSQYGLSDFTNNESQKHEKDFSALWKPLNSMTTNPDPDESKASVLKQMMPEARKRVAEPYLEGKSK